MAKNEFRNYLATAAVSVIPGDVWFQILSEYCRYERLPLPSSKLLSDVESQQGACDANQIIME